MKAFKVLVVAMLMGVLTLIAPSGAQAAAQPAAKCRVVSSTTVTESQRVTFFDEDGNTLVGQRTRSVTTTHERCRSKVYVSTSRSGWSDIQGFTFPMPSFP